MTTVIAVGISSSLSPMGYAALMLAVAAYALYSVFVDLALDYTGAEITYAMLLSGAAFYGPAGAGRGGGARRADGAADAAGEKQGVPDGSALSGRGLFGGGVFPPTRRLRKSA